MSRYYILTCEFISLEDWKVTCTNSFPATNLKEALETFKALTDWDSEEYFIVRYCYSEEII